MWSETFDHDATKSKGFATTQHPEASFNLILPANDAESHLLKFCFRLSDAQQQCKNSEIKSRTEKCV